MKYKEKLNLMENYNLSSGDTTIMHIFCANAAIELSPDVTLVLPLLLKHLNFDVNIKDCKQQTLLMISALKAVSDFNSTSEDKALLDAGYANTKILLDHHNTNCLLKDENGFTAYEAIKANQNPGHIQPLLELFEEHEKTDHHKTICMKK